jgi:hypothetical protein
VQRIAVLRPARLFERSGSGSSNGSREGSYLRVLGFQKKARALISEIARQKTAPLIQGTAISKLSSMIRRNFETDALSTDILCLCNDAGDKNAITAGPSSCKPVCQKCYNITAAYRGVFFLGLFRLFITLIRRAPPPSVARFVFAASRSRFQSDS